MENMKEKAYEILLQHHLNENRLFAERVSMFLLSSSILFVGFVLLIPISKVLCTAAGAMGLIMCAVAYGALRACITAMQFWHNAQEKIEKEEEGTFAYMRDKEISPQIHGWEEWKKGKIEGMWKLFPLLAWVFFALWAFLLIYVWCFMQEEV